MGVRYSINEKFFDAWSPEMAYVLGFIYADGHLINAPYMRGKYVCITNTDKDRLELFQRALRSQHVLVERERGGNNKKTYILRIGNSKLFDSLSKYGLTPRKSLTISFPKIPRTFLPFFILGYFDGDGCVYAENLASGRPRRLKTIFTSGSRNFLEELDAILRKRAGIKGGGIYQHGSTRNAFQIRYTARDSIRLYQYLYTEKSLPLALSRKYDIFRKYFDGLGIRGSDFPAILKKKGPVANEERIGLQNRH